MFGKSDRKHNATLYVRHGSRIGFPYNNRQVGSSIYCMCGIAGIWRWDGQPVEEDRLQRMAEAIAHRGPDGEGSWVEWACIKRVRVKEKVLKYIE